MSAAERWVKLIGTIGAAANWTIPIASFASIKDDPAKINPVMTSTLAFYSIAFIRWSIAIHPPNYLLTACHIANETAQLIQLSRWASWKAKGAPEKIENAFPSTTPPK
eukprot:TRINITY_DN964_c0_g1_i1.p1 TRINITY_DN964_c0_g1~~TRINITY_DN964_c0_g1_i1.p1  ORF type:complete len:108 (-),score=30.54 TRINITY_DN964_c0_g1_i1:122-445(-)